MNHSNRDAAAGARTPPRRRWLAAAAVATAFVAGGLTLPALTASAQDAAMHSMMGGAHGDMHAMAMAHIGKMLDEVGANADQKARITALLHAGMKPMADLHAGMHESMASLHAILSAPTIDRAALEQLRAGEIARVDQASKAMVQAIADAAEVLRPDQRAKLATMMREHHNHP